MKRMLFYALCLAFSIMGCQNTDLAPGNPETAPKKPTVQIGKKIGSAKALSFGAALTGFAAPGAMPKPTASPTGQSMPAPAKEAADNLAGEGVATPLPAPREAPVGQNSMGQALRELNIDPEFYAQHFIRPAVGMQWDYKLSVNLRKLMQAMMPGRSGTGVSMPETPESVTASLRYSVAAVAGGTATVKLHAVPLSPPEFVSKEPFNGEEKTPADAPALLLGLSPWLGSSGPGQAAPPTPQPQVASMPFRLAQMQSFGQPTLEMTFVIDGVEDITVPAGTFKEAVKVAIKTEYAGVAGLPPQLLAMLPKAEAYLWVTPEAGLIKRTETMFVQQEKVEYLVQELQAFQK